MKAPSGPHRPSLNIAVRPLEQRDLPTADHIMRVAFGTFLGLPEPAAFMGDASFVLPRWEADPSAAFAAEIDGELVGSNFATRWGSFGFFGPLTIRPDLWDRGVGKRLMEPILECFERWRTKHAGLFTFAHSQKHVGLYQRFGFWPRFLTAILAKPVAQTPNSSKWTGFSDVLEPEREGVVQACAQLTDAIYEGLDVGSEIRAVAHQDLGETVLLWDGDSLAGLAICHFGAGTEGGSETCYVKFGAVRPNSSAERNFDRLLDVCEALAAERGLSQMVAGVNTARHEAYRQMLAHGFRTQFQGVAMQRPNEPGFNRPGLFVIDDWR